ncbi:hypothetical protein SDRG_11952 [Saprolegnia diclina VS20]|uniref:Uncharacterized protein n=1 Tax=Saprolegnia diclina (strain VS20) TaxID=1156394 RepID=T0QA47_SAPDV|nr:hypothetical protein SDRG_11952 [Saprolegnia diclina VS20]EQC30375.1 hypothetical protein SDRG_11952 [Saprolegnia diclina VS20]|eukprot:XP_008616228.1 hypothetical protein SDRG_11952 [Saprolegnia diclina VS20]
MSTYALSGRERETARLERSIAELRRVASQTYEQDKATDLLSRLRQASSGDSTYIQEDATSRWNAQVQPTSDISPWPPALRPLVSSPGAKFGLFKALKHAWLIAGPTVYLWDYTSSKGTIVTCPAMPDPVLACGVTQPLSGSLFSDVVQHLLVVVTETEVRVLALVADKTTGSFKVQDTLMNAPLPSTTLLSTVVCTPSRRILLGGVDGALYEYVYHPHLPKPPTTEKARSVRVATSHWNQYLPPLVRDLLAPARSAITQLLYDDARHVIYALHSSGHVSVYDARTKDIVCVTYTIIDASIVSLSLVSDGDASIHAVAITSAGVRLFLSTSQTLHGPPDTCMVVFTRPPPPCVTVVDRAVYASGVSFFGHKSTLVSAAADVGLATSYRELVRSHALLGGHMVVEETSVVLASPAGLPSLKRSASGASLPSSLDFLRISRHELSTQFTSTTPRAFVSLSEGGVQCWHKQRPLDHLRHVLTHAPGPLTRSSPMVASYGPHAIACMLFALACDPSPPRPPAHLMSLVFDIGGHPDGSAHSDHYNGLVRVLVRFLSGIWHAALAKATTKGAASATFTPALSKDEIARPRDLLCRLKQLLEHVAVPYAVAVHATSSSSSDGSMIATEQRALQDIHALLGRCIGACEGLLLVYAHPTAFSHVANLAFYDVVCTELGAKALQAMLRDVAKETPLVVPTALARCSAFFTLVDAGVFQGTDALTRAKAAATPSARDAALNESLTKLVAAAPTWPPTAETIEHLGRIAKDYELCSFWKGLVGLAVAVAARWPLHSADQKACYSGVLDALAHVAEHNDVASAQSIVGLVVGTTDVHLQQVVLEWVVSKGHKTWLLHCPLTPTVRTVLAADVDWLAALCLEHHEYEEAATVLWKAAHDVSATHSIGDRTAWVARALSSIQHTTNAQHAKDIQDALDVFQTQTRLATAFRQHNLGSDAVRHTLEFEILDMSTLYHEYAMPYERYEDCLRIMHACRFYEPETIVMLWKKALYSLLPQVADRDAAAPIAKWLDEAYAAAGLGDIVSMSSAFEACEWTRSVSHLVVSLGRALHPSPVFPIEWLITEVETIAMHAWSLGHHTSPFTPVHLFVDLGMPASDVLAWYLHLFGSSTDAAFKVQLLWSLLALRPGVPTLPSTYQDTMAHARNWLVTHAPDQVDLVAQLLA